jgi:Zn-dependent protease with chaperone function
MWKAVVVVVCLGLGVFADAPKQSELSAKALQFFMQIADANFDLYLKRVRLPKVRAEVKAETLAQLAKVETLKPSEKTQAKLLTLLPVLQYHERDAVVDIQITNQREAFVGFRGRAVLLISQPALSILSAEELQAVVAHELGHEYFWGEMMEAQQQKRYDVMRELELRSDGIAVIALHRLGVDPAHLLAAITRIRAFNARLVDTDSLRHPLLTERAEFIRAMSELVKAREAAESVSARNANH